MERLLVGDSEGGSLVLVATVARAVPHVFQRWRIDESNQGDHLHDHNNRASGAAATDPFQTPIVHARAPDALSRS